MVLSDRTIREEIKKGRIVISPLGEGCIQPASVDVHLDSKILVFRNSRRPYVRLTTAAENLYGSSELGSKYQGQKLPTASKIHKDFPVQQ